MSKILFAECMNWRLVCYSMCDLEADYYLTLKVMVIKHPVCHGGHANPHSWLQGCGLDIGHPFANHGSNVI